MNKTLRILHPTDLSPNAIVAFKQAIQVAQQLNARLDMLHIAPTFGADPLRNAFDASIDEKQFYEKLIDEMDQQMSNLQDELQNDPGNDLQPGNLEIRRVHLRSNSYAEAITNYAAEQDIDLIVMGTHGHRGLKKLFMGSTAYEVVRNAPCGVLTVNLTAEEAIFAATEPVVLVPVDLGEHSEKLLQSAVDVAARFNYSVELLHILENTYVPAFGLNAADLYDLLPSRKEGVQQQLDRLVEKVDLQGVTVNTTIKEGAPSEKIIETAKELNCSLILLAPDSMNWLERFPFGSVSEQILTKACRPVYTLPASEEA